METPFGVNVVVVEPEGQVVQAAKEKWPGEFPLDREVIAYLRQLTNSINTK